MVRSNIILIILMLKKLKSKKTHQCQTM